MRHFANSVIFLLPAVLAPGIAWSQQTPSPVYRDHSRLDVYLDDKGHEQPIKSAEDWARRRRDILAGMQAAMGPLPDRSKLAPLDVQISKEEKHSGYTRLAISFQAEPGDRVPAHLYLPERRPSGKRLPAMLVLHQTSALGKGDVAEDSPRPNRGFAPEIVRRGYIVLAPDYPSFGDYKDYNFQSDRYQSGTMKGIFNHMRGVDLLQARDDVDPERIGTLGHSLGGHNSMFVGVFDERIKVIVSSCGWTPFHEYYGGKIAGWTSDRYMPRLRDVYQLDPDRVPFDFYEVVAALAPRPFFSNSPLGDGNFDVAGVKKAIPKAREVYTLLGAADRLEVRYPDCDHDFPPEVRREAYQFVDRALAHKAWKNTP